MCICNKEGPFIIHIMCVYVITHNGWSIHNSHNVCICNKEGSIHNSHNVCICNKEGSFIIHIMCVYVIRKVHS